MKLLSDKFVGKYMRMAKQVGEDQNPCLSRSIGVVTVHPIENRVISTGYNGPPKGVPHCDTEAHLRDYVWPQLTYEEKSRLLSNHDDLVKEHVSYINNGTDPEESIEAYKDILCGDGYHGNANCGQCPRRLVGAKSGQRLELCSCAHGERNAVTNATESLYGCYMFCWCGIPCNECTKTIINSGIEKVYCLGNTEQYQEGDEFYKFDMSRWMFKQAKIETIELQEEEAMHYGIV